MSGLYQKALSIIRERQPPGISRGDERAVDEEKDISPEEREKILTQIDETVARNRIEIKPETFSFTPKYSGSLLPILINGFAVAAILGGIYLSLLFFNRSEKSIVTRSAAIKTAEGRLIQTLKQEAAESLNKKEQEISEIRNRLAAMNSEREKLKLESEEQVLKREQQLKDDLAKELESERQKLQSGGLKEEAIEQQLITLEAEKRKEYEGQLELLKKQAEDELAGKEAALNAKINEYEQTLSQTQIEKTRLQDELEGREAALQAQFEEKETALERDRGGAIEQLDRMREQQEREQLILDQILSSYDKINKNIKAAQPDEALRNLDNLKKFLDQDSLTTLPKIQKRLQVELFIVRSLEELIKMEPAGEKPGLDSRPDSVDVVALISSLIEQGNNRFEEGDYPAAQELYLSALVEIPAVELGYAKLKEIEEKFSEQERQELSGIIASGNASYLAGDYGKAVERYGRALEYLQENRESVSRMLARIMEAGYRLKAADELARSGRIEVAEAERKAILDGLRAAREQYARLSVKREQSSEESRESLVALLESKLLLRQIISSETVRTRYPELYNKTEEYFDKTEQYFEAFGEEKRKNGQYSTLEDINTLLDNLINGERKENLSGVLDGYEEPSHKELFLKFIDKLQVLLQ